MKCRYCPRTFTDEILRANHHVYQHHVPMMDDLVKGTPYEVKER